ncbi:MAG: 4Fe-4S binding protein [Desulfovibrio sp.]|uniref:4Fe-4S binding protein n=1 Tax=Desulfovibrio sp. TaxID=885 RepID=UPI0039E3E5B5
MKFYTLARRCVQLAVLALFCSLPWINEAGLRQIRGSLFSLDFFGVSFADPVAALQVAAGGELIAGPLLWGAACSLILALVLGRVFCSWVCPYGFLSELVHRWAVRVATGSAVARHKSISKHQGKVFAAKVFVLLAGLLLVISLEYPVVNVLGMPGEISLVPVLAWQGAGASVLLTALVLPVVALVLEMASGRRLWCRYVCPQSVLLGAAAWCLPARAPGLRIVWKGSQCDCRGEVPCRAACSLQLTPRRTGGPGRRDCTACGDCLRACESRGGALRWNIFPQQPEKKKE